jgi:hypothetical protein
MNFPSRFDSFGLLEILFLIAPWIVVPLGLSLSRKGKGAVAVEAHANRRLRTGLWLAAALAGTVSFCFPRGGIAAALAARWLVFGILVLLESIIRFFRSPVWSFGTVTLLISKGYLVVGAIWLVISRSGLEPLGFQEPIVFLTAVHFHYAGFASGVMAALAYERLESTAWTKWAWAIFPGVVLGPGLLGLAFLAGPKVKLFAALWIVAGQFGVAAATLHIASKGKSGAGRILLCVSAGSVFVAMAFAAVWAIGEFPLQPFVDLYRMERIHGVLNALGFGVCGMAGWKMLD